MTKITDYVKIAEAAEILGVAQNTLRKWAQRGDMGCVVTTTESGVYLNSFCFGFRLHDLDEHAPGFLAYTFRSDVGRSLMFALAQRATRYNMSKRQFLNLELQLPNVDEQREIVKVLSDMDAEIAALEQRRDKTKAIKQGMMQSLLTGRVRLIKPEGSP